MAWETASFQNGNKEQRDDPDGIAIRTQYLSQGLESSPVSRRDRKKTYCFVLLIVVVVGLIVSTIFFGVQSHRYERLYDTLAVKTSGSLYRLNVHGSKWDLNRISSESWMNTAQWIVENCLSEGTPKQIEWQCLKRKISALKRLSD